MTSENTLRNPSRDYKTNILLQRNPHYRYEQKTVHWTAKFIRIKNYLESKGHEFIDRIDSVYYFDGLEPMKMHRLRLYYDRCVYQDRKNQLNNWSQG